MNKLTFSLITTLAAVLLTAFFCPQANAVLVDLTTDGGGAFNITAVPMPTKLSNPALGNFAANGQMVKTWVYQDTSPTPNPIPANSGIPILRMRLTAGQMVTVNFKNLLPAGENPEGASIHWHGIELDNDSDGVAVTQDTVHVGDTYTYRFVAPRPGLFWFHSHMVPGDELFAGMYGVIIVTDPCEVALIGNNVVPGPASTFQIAMSDIEWDRRPNLLSSLQVGRLDAAAIDGGGFKTINKWIHDCGNGPAGNGPGNNSAICKAAAFPGDTVLVNGCNPDTMQVAGSTTFPVTGGQTIRLQLFNEALTRNFDVYLENATNHAKVNLIRIGGQGGLLDRARLEGDIPVAGGANANSFGWQTLYDSGHISLSSGIRADAVACIPSVPPGTPLVLMGKNNTAMWPLQIGANPANGFAIPATFPLAFFQVVPGAPPPVACIVSNSPIRAALGPAGGCCPIPNLTNNMAIDSFIVPPGGFPVRGGVPQGSVNPTITLNSGGNGPAIDGLDLSFLAYPGGQPLDGNVGNGTAWQVPPLATDRYAYVGSLLVLSVNNATGAGNPLAHPFHLHGFSMQPISMVDGNGVEHKFGYNEFLDTIDVYGANQAAQTYIFSVRLEDGPKFCDLSSGTGPNKGPVLQPCTDGACGGLIGRWLYRCHIAEHGVIGMMGEIIVLARGNQPMGIGQPPDTISPGVDVLATAGTGSQTVADDFLWQNPGPITHVTIWGSWLNNMLDPNATFDLKFWTDVPACNPTPSHPGWQAWYHRFPPGTYAISNYYTLPPFAEAFVDPSQGNCVPPGDNIIYQYDFDMPNILTDFKPLPGSPVNWISVTAYTATNSGYRFGWKTTPRQYGWNDDSSWSSTVYGPPWSELVYPPCINNPNIGFSMNQAFQLYIPGSTTCPPGTNCLQANGPAFSVQQPVLTATLSGDRVTVTWSGGGTLQYSAGPSGPWSVVPDFTGTPYVTPATGTQRFYRVVLP